MFRKPVAIFIATAITLAASCGKDTNIINPPNIVDQQKDNGFIAVYPNAYESIGSLAKDHDNSGVNHTIELDNALKYTLNGKEFAYYAFSATIKLQPNVSKPVFYFGKANNNSEITEIPAPKPDDITKMVTASLKYTGDKNSPAIYSDELAKQLLDKGYLCWKNQSTESTATEDKYTFLVSNELVPSVLASNYQTTKATIHLKFKENNSDDWIELVRSPIHVAVIGDSVMWGQGVAKKDNLFTKLINDIQKTKGQIVRFNNYARSGAEFGSPNNNSGTDLNGEIPNSSPTINAQLNTIFTNYRPFEGTEKVDKNVDPKRIDLIVMDGGINNISPTGILLGFNPNTLDAQAEQLQEQFNQGAHIDANNNDIKSIIKKVTTVLTSQDPNFKKLRKNINDTYCFNEEKNNFSGCSTPKDSNAGTFMEDARKKAPNAQLVVAGYFPLLSDNSNVKCDAPVTITNPINNQQVSFNMGVYGLFGFLVFLASQPKLGTPLAAIVAGSAAVAGGPLGNYIRTGAINRSQFWTNQSNRILIRAVELANDQKDLPGRGIARFAAIAQNFQKNTIFSPAPYIWGFADNKCQKDGLLFPPEDTVFNERKLECDKLGDADKFMCYRASFFHPNIKGYEKGYLPEIINSLKYGGLYDRSDL